MKRFLLMIVTVAMMFALIGCGNKESEEETINPLTEKIYYHNDKSETFGFSYMKFYDDNTCQGVNGEVYKDQKTEKNEVSYESFYGTYEIEGNKITLNMGNESFKGVINEGGDKINFGSEKFVDWTENINETDSLLSEFDK